MDAIPRSEGIFKHSLTRYQCRPERPSARCNVEFQLIVKRPHARLELPPPPLPPPESLSPAIQRHPCVSHATPSPLPSVFILGQWQRNGIGQVQPYCAGLVTGYRSTTVTRGRISRRRTQSVPTTKIVFTAISHDDAGDGFSISLASGIKLIFKARLFDSEHVTKHLVTRVIHLPHRPVKRPFLS